MELNIGKNHNREYDYNAMNTTLPWDGEERIDTSEAGTQAAD